ncbi:MAG: DUF5312 family protein [Treponema sp.]|jgi:hypothetical protein|nr:DUF5312 family protein [Treponema sp.]
MAIVLFERIASLFGKTQDPETEKRKLLKLVRKDITQSEYHKFFKMQNEELGPPMGKFFFDLYKPLAPLQILMQNVAKSTRMKQLIIEHYMGNELVALQERLSSASIEERAKIVSNKELLAQVQNDLGRFSLAFSNNCTVPIDRSYNLLLTLAAFATFDFFYILKHFDKNFTAQAPNYQPKFGHVRASVLIEALKDFLEVAYPLDQSEGWATLFKLLKASKNEVDIIDPSQWNKLLALLHEVQRSSIIALIIRFVEKNPVWQSKPSFPGEHIAKTHLQMIQAEAEECIDRIINSKRNAKINELAHAVFGNLPGERMKYYTDRYSEIYEKKNMGSFLYTKEVNYLKVFLIDYYKKEVRELCDLFLIRGQWTTQSLAKPLSDAFHAVMTIIEKLLLFDEDLADDRETASRMKNYLLRADRDKGQAHSLKILLNTVNDTARKLSVTAAKELIALGIQLKNLYNDYEKNPHEYIINWKEIESVSETPIIQRISAVHKRIYNFVRMLKLFIEPAEE